MFLQMSDPARRLADARARLDAAGAALRGKHQGNALGEFRAAYYELLAAERALAASRDEEHAVPCAGFPAWDVGAPLPHVLTGARGFALAYFTKEPDPTWDGTSARVVDVADESMALVALIRFERPTAIRVGPPNDEVIHGHPLHGRGLAAYEAHEVVRSRWVQELQTINSVHSQYDPARWKDRHHYLLAFHDETVECVAGGFTAEVRMTTLAQACRDLLERLMGTRTAT